MTRLSCMGNTTESGLEKHIHIHMNIDDAQSLSPSMSHGDLLALQDQQMCQTPACSITTSAEETEENLRPNRGITQRLDRCLEMTNVLLRECKAALALPTNPLIQGTRPAELVEGCKPMNVRLTRPLIGAQATKSLQSKDRSSDLMTPSGAVATSLPASPMEKVRALPQLMTRGEKWERTRKWIMEVAEGDALSESQALPAKHAWVIAHRVSGNGRQWENLASFHVQLRW